MLSIRRGLTYVAAVVLLLAATSGSTFAQELRDRELKPAFDFSKIQMPIEIGSIKLKGEDFQPGQKIRGDDNWLEGLSFTVKNISDKPIAYVDIGLRFPRPEGFVVYSLNYGVDLSRGERPGASSPPPIQPGASLDLVLTKHRYKTFLEILDRGGASATFDVAQYFVARICFEGQPDLIWEGGNLKRRDPNIFSEFDVVERYVLPPVQQ